MTAAQGGSGKIDYDALLPDQQRVVLERDELEARYITLGAYLASPKSNTIDPEERARLCVQYSIMHAYLQVLEMRIAKFTSGQ